ncbi:probable glutathione S-transferase isoform X2 [Macadamia integrifolia]|uniref:probable glutathione S-transferase isoform X2 n=1 Tax=Macadamia integrifolia TaxID=60698 RepID=UPI001C52F783|nr:probable glutathione S-transferase isoform X2 [Macadamia integrifolia]
MKMEEEKELKLLGTKLSPFSWRVRWVLKLKGIEYEFIEEDLRNKSPLLLSSNPVHKMVPVLIHGGKAIPESRIIILYIEETWMKNPILPSDPYERAQALFWAKFADEKIHMAFSSTGDDQVKAVESATEALEALEGEIKGKRFFGGERIGFADIVVGWIAYWLEMVEEAACFKVWNSKNFPSLHSWMNNFLEVNVIRENLPPRDDLRAFFHDLRQVSVIDSRN